jgi:hypothetical protein
VVKKASQAVKKQEKQEKAAQGPILVPEGAVMALKKPYGVKLDVKVPNGSRALKCPKCQGFTITKVFPFNCDSCKVLLLKPIK